MNNQWEYIRFHESANLMLFIYRDRYLTKREIEEICETLQTKIGRNTIGIYRIVKNEEIVKVLDEMDTTLNERFFQKEIHYMEVKKNIILEEFSLKEIDFIMENIRENKWKEKMEKTIDDVFKNNFINGSNLKKFYDSVLILIANKYIKYNLVIPEELKKDLNPFILSHYTDINEVLEKIKLSMDIFHERLIEEMERDGTVEKIIWYLETFYAENITLSDIANEFFISPNYITKKFREKKGITAMQYLENIRLKEAEKLLENTNYSVTEIAGKCGYNDANYFARAFKKKNKVTPKMYRQNII